MVGTVKQPKGKSNPHLEAALSYLRRGWPVIPLCWPDDQHRCGCPKGHRREKEIGDNGFYGVELYVKACFGYGEAAFMGAVRGSGNVISGNKKGKVCPSPELDFLMAEEESCCGALCE